MKHRPRYPSMGWQRPLALLLGLCLFLGYVRLWMIRADLVPRYDLVAYARLSLPEDFPFWKSYQLLFGPDRRLATVMTEGVLTSEQVRLEALDVSRETLREWLRNNVYDGEGLPVVLRWPLAAGVFSTALLLWVATQLTEAFPQNAWDGWVLRGPRLVSHRRFNWRTLFRRKNAFYLETK